jgi:hypothetical protein
MKGNPMLVKLLVSRATNDGAQNRGDEIEVSAEEADSLIAAGQAELVRAAPAERAVGRGPKPESAI